MIPGTPARRTVKVNVGPRRRPPRLSASRRAALARARRPLLSDMDAMLRKMSHSERPILAKLVLVKNPLTSSPMPLHYRFRPSYARRLAPGRLPGYGIDNILARVRSQTRYRSNRRQRRVTGFSFRRDALGRRRRYNRVSWIPEGHPSYRYKRRRRRNLGIV